MANPISFLSRHLSFVGAGVMDRIISRTTGKKFCFGKHVATRLNACRPWTDHFESSTLVNMETAYKDGDFSSLRFLAAIGVSETALPECVEVANMAIDLIAKGVDVEYDLFFLE